jgi:hypothetical protein
MSKKAPKKAGAKAAQASPVGPGKHVRPLPSLPGAGNSGDRLCWRFTHVDHDGQWGLGEADSGILYGVLGHLGTFESMTVDEAFHRGDYPGKDYDVEAIPNSDALDRLEALGLADQTKIWALRCGGKPRLWGFLEANVFHLVFWDAEHEIWPSPLKHT